MPSNDFANQSQFDYMFDALAQKFPALQNFDGVTSIFQFSATPIAADWVDNLSAHVFDSSNIGSSSLDGFFVPTDNFYNSYKDLISSIKPANYTANADYEAFQQQLTNLNNQETGIQQNTTAAYQVWLANNPTPTGTPPETYGDWLKDMAGGKSWGDQLQALEDQKTALIAESAALVASMDSALAGAITDLSADTMNISRGSSVLKVPSFSISGSLSADKMAWDKYTPGQCDFSVTIDKDQTITTPWTVTYQTTVKQKCWNTSVDVSSQVSRIISDNNYKLVVQAVGMESYTITRGEWYHDAFVKPTVPFADGSIFNSDTFFGQGGSLHLIPETIFVWYKPTMTLTISTEVYKQVFTQGGGADINWLDIFGTRFHFESLASLQAVPNADSTTTVTFPADPGVNPQIIGVTCSVRYDGH
jgi:hypothetical protein